MSRATITPQIQIEGLNGVTETKQFTLSSGILSTDLSVYSKARVDQLITQGLQGADAMHFAGTLDNGNNNATISLSNLASATNIASGATYKVIESFDTDDATLAGITITGLTGATEVGDLIIVTGTETNGVITSNATYTYVPAGDDTDIYWTPSTLQDNEISFAKSVGGDIEKLVFAEAANSQITLSAAHTTSGSGNRTKTQTITIGHSSMGTPTVTTANSVSANPNDSSAVNSYTAITGLTLTNGHVTGYTTTQLDLWSNKLVKVVSQAAVPTGTTNTIKLTSAYYNQDNSQAAKNDWQVSSDTLTLTVPAGGQGSLTMSGTTVTASTPADIHIDMVWGSFT